MIPSERARKIANQVSLVASGERQWLIKEIAAEIEAAVNEVRKSDALHKLTWADGFRAAREKAVKLEDHMCRDPHACDAGLYAERIKKMEP